MKSLQLKTFVASALVCGFILGGCSGGGNVDSTSAVITDGSMPGSGGSSSEGASDTSQQEENNQAGSTDTTDDANGDETTQETDSNAWNIAISESGENSTDTYMIVNHPVLEGDTVYAELIKERTVEDNTLGMKVVAYDFSTFEKDASLETFVSRVYYNETQKAEDADPSFDLRYYNILVTDGHLYFSALPASENKSQSRRIAIDLSTNTPVYDIKTDPVLGEKKDMTFDLTRGWLVPFGEDNSYIGIAEEASLKVMERIDGSSYEYGGYDYLTDGDNDAKNKAWVMPPVSTSTTCYYATSYFYKMAYLTDNAYVEYGTRQIERDPSYVKKDILKAFNAVYTGEKEYTLVNYDDDGFVLTPPEMILDGEHIYHIARLSYKDANDNRLTDLYLLDFDQNGDIKEIVLLEEGTSATDYLFAYQPYKYGNTLFFKVQKGYENFLYAFDLNEKKRLFVHKIGNANLSWYVRDKVDTPYVITGSVLVLPDFIASGENGESYDVVFDVIDIKDGHSVTVIKHEKLSRLDLTKDKVRFHTALSNRRALFFFAARYNDETARNLVVRIAPPVENTTLKSRYRIDTHFSGVYR